MKLFWSAYSPFARKVMVTAGELGLSSRIERISVWVGITDLNETVMQSNPLNQIPVLIGDDGYTYSDSRVICEYLDSLHQGRHLFPDSSTGRWQTLCWQSLVDGVMQISVIWRNERMRSDELRSQAHLVAYEAKARAALQKLELDAPRLISADLGIGHIAIACALGYLDLRFADLEWRKTCPRLHRWHSEFTERPSYAATTAWLQEAQRAV